MRILWRVQLSLLLVALATFLKALAAKLLCTHFYRTAHLSKVQEALDKVRLPPAVSLSVNHPVKQSVSQSISQSVSQASSHSINQCGELVSQPVYQSAMQLARC